MIPEEAAKGVRLEWFQFMERSKAIMAKRQPGDPVVMMVPHVTDGGEAFVHLTSFDLQPIHTLAMVIHLIGKLSKDAPQSASIRKLKKMADRTLGTVDIGGLE